MVLGQALHLTGLGILLGLAGAFVAARWIATLLFGVEPLDATTFVATSLLMLAAAILATMAPAWRATRVDPATALRHE
jgi:ABC-type lipoprotein release transport system permease subunit